MKGRDFGYNDSYQSFDRESFDPTLVGVLSRTLERQRNFRIFPLRSSCVLIQDRKSLTKQIQLRASISSSAGPNQTSSDLTDKCLCLKLLRILSKNICRGFFFCQRLVHSPRLVNENGASVNIKTNKKWFCYHCYLPVMAIQRDLPEPDMLRFAI